MSNVTEFFNPNHDHKGRFATTGGRHAVGNAPTYRPPFSKTDQLKSIQRVLMTAAELRRSLEPDEKIALEDYTKTFQGSHAINTALRGEAKVMWGGKLFTSDQQTQTTVKSVEAIEHLFDKTPLNLAPLQVMRGLGNVGKSWGKVGSLEGAILSSDTLNSTTMESRYAAYAATATARLAGNKPGKGVLMVMYAPEGTVRALPASDILHGASKGLRPEPGHEIILPPGTRVKVHSDEVNMDRSPGTAGEAFDRIVRVEILPEDPNYRQNISYRDNFAGAFEAVSAFYNANHDAKGRFATTGGAPALNSHIRMVPKDEIARRLEVIRAKKAAYENGPIGLLRKAHGNAQFSATELTAMKFYEGSFDRSKVINDIFRKGDYGKLPETLASVSRETIFTHAAALKVALAKSPALTQEATLYRTIRNIPESWQGHPSFEGATIQDPGFMSTTSKKADADYYLNHTERTRPGGPKAAPPAQLILTAPVGTKALPIDLHVQGAATEELLLAPGTAFKVTKDTTTESGVRQIHGEIILPTATLSALLDLVTDFYNPNHDGKGRFAPTSSSPVHAIEVHYKNTPLPHEQDAAVRFYEGHFGRAGAMNDLLRYGEINEMNATSLRHSGIRQEKVAVHIDSLKQAFREAPRLRKDIVVERIVRNVPKAWVKPKAGYEEAAKEMRDALDESNRLMTEGKDFRSAVARVSAARAKVLALKTPDKVDLTGLTIKDNGFMSTATNPEKLAMYQLQSQIVDGRNAVPAKLRLTVPAGTPVIPVDVVLGRGGAENEMLLPPGREIKVSRETVEDGIRVIHGEIAPYTSH